MKTSDYNYEYDENLIAQSPLEKRDDSRLLVLRRKDGSISHRTFKDLAELLPENSFLIFNNTKVIKAILSGKKETGGNAEFLLLKNLGDNSWECLCKKSKKMKPGAPISFLDGLLRGTITEKKDDGILVMKLDGGNAAELIESHGRTPLPPYVKNKNIPDERYQTIYAEKNGASAAPTAGLHFTDETFVKLKEKSIEWEFVTLHIGIDTFKPVYEEDIENHRMHREFCQISPETAEKINTAIKRNKTIIAVGTSAVRALESSGMETDRTLINPLNNETGLYIYPGYEFKITKGLITNFHLPRTTLLMLVSAFAGRETIMKAYRTAVSEKYRLFSFGDAMLIL